MNRGNSQTDQKNNNHTLNNEMCLAGQKLAKKNRRKKHAHEVWTSRHDLLTHRNYYNIYVMCHRIRSHITKLIDTHCMYYIKNIDVRFYYYYEEDDNAYMRYGKCVCVCVTTSRIFVFIVVRD